MTKKYRIYREQSEAFRAFLRRHGFKYLVEFHNDTMTHMKAAAPSYSTLRDIYKGITGINLELYLFMNQRYHFELDDWQDSLSEEIHIDKADTAAHQKALPGIRYDQMLERRLGRVV